MDSVKNWYRSKPTSFSQQRSQDLDFNTSSFKPNSYGTTDRVLKTASNVCKKITPSSETRTAVVNTVEHYGRKLIPNESTKQKVSRFYESQVAKLKYAQLKEGYQPTDRDDLQRFADDDSFYGQNHGLRRFDHQVPEESTSASSTRTSPWDRPVNTPTTEWNHSFMQFKEPGKTF